MAVKNDSGAPIQPGDAGQAAAGAPQEIRLRLDERDLRTSYANVFVTNATPDEVMVDFALNLGARPVQAGGQPEMVWQARERIIMNYYMAKRLALTLAQIIRTHEQQFGELELDVGKRRKT